MLSNENLNNDGSILSIWVPESRVHLVSVNSIVQLVSVDSVVGLVSKNGVSVGTIVDWADSSNGLVGGCWGTGLDNGGNWVSVSDLLGHWSLVLDIASSNNRDGAAVGGVVWRVDAAGDDWDSIGLALNGGVGKVASDALGVDDSRAAANTGVDHVDSAGNGQNGAEYGNGLHVEVRVRPKRLNWRNV